MFILWMQAVYEYKKTLFFVLLKHLAHKASEFENLETIEQEYNDENNRSIQEHINQDSQYEPNAENK